MTQRRVVITGLGQVSPVGNDVPSAWQNLLAGKSGISKITRFDASDIACQIAGEVKDFDVTQYIPPKEARRMDAFIHYGIAGAMQAIADARLDEFAELDKDRVGVNIGSGIGGLPAIEATANTVAAGGARKINPFFIPSSLINLIAGHVTILKGYRGPSYGIVSACTTSAHAIGDSMRMIQYGDADVMIAGGAEGAVCTLGIGGFAAMKALSTRNDDPAAASRPWDKDRDGFVMGEGSAVFVLEEYEHAKKRGAKIYAELAGYGGTSDGYHLTAPNPDGVWGAVAMTEALKDAGVKPEEVQYYNAHGTATKKNDPCETQMLKIAFGEENAKKLHISSTKSMTGHCLGATGAIEAMFAVKAIQEGFIPPTINLDEQDVEGGCDLNYTPNKGIECKVDCAMSSTFGFGGHNGVIVLKRI